MVRTPRDVTNAELSVLQILWDEGQTTIRKLTDRLYPPGGTSYYATVQKLLQRLENKGFVKRDRSAQVHVFRAVVGRDELIDRRLQEMAEQLCGGSLTPLLTHLVRAGSLSAQDRNELRELVDELDRKPSSRSSRKA